MVGRKGGNTTVQNSFAIKMYHRLRRGDFRYATILFKAVKRLNLYFAFGEAIWGTQQYLILVKSIFTIHFLLAFGEASLGTQRYIAKQVRDLMCLSPSAMRL